MAKENVFANSYLHLSCKLSSLWLDKRVEDEGLVTCEKDYVVRYLWKRILCQKPIHSCPQVYRI